MKRHLVQVTLDFDCPQLEGHSRQAGSKDVDLAKRSLSAEQMEITPRIVRGKLVILLRVGVETPIEDAKAIGESLRAPLAPHAFSSDLSPVEIASPSDSPIAVGR